LNIDISINLFKPTGNIRLRQRVLTVLGRMQQAKKAANEEE